MESRRKYKLWYLHFSFLQKKTAQMYMTMSCQLWIGTKYPPCLFLTLDCWQGFLVWLQIAPLPMDWAGGKKFWWQRCCYFLSLPLQVCSKSWTSQWKVTGICILFLTWVVLCHLGRLTGTLQYGCSDGRGYYESEQFLLLKSRGMFNL